MGPERYRQRDHNRKIYVRMILLHLKILLRNAYNVKTILSSTMYINNHRHLILDIYDLDATSFPLDINKVYY